MPTRTPRKVVAVLLAAALVIAASASDDDSGATADGGPAGPDATAPPPAPTLGGADDGPVPDPGADPAGPSGGQAPPPPSPGTADPGSTTSTSRSQPAPDPGAVGDYAPFYLRSGESDGLILDLRSQAGAEPGQRTVSHLQAVLTQVSSKPVDVSGGAIPGDARDWTATEIQALADAGGLAQTRDRAVMHVLFLRGGFAGEDTVLGVAVRSDVAAIFSDRVAQAAGPVGSSARIEDAVTIHEAGHLLGLVDLFLSTGREDPDHPGHSPNRNSVMYFAVESTLVGTLLSGGPPTEFDRADLADLDAIRNG